ncbi:SDR family oxidoreductase [Mycobacterium sherrisii]|uniref:Oxidoreductase n=1 Tax=Mycobacterium sherrisii TaxID=243061 RepID=A0A1E3T305_9MYCO|nr:SDR family NAD(P)-dependent oxidoreductase [Mycobacterium sherrisii]MCV7029814.1 SDR family NAD(P)-dependent oxidoreductase [Mycobacterium sherrisii]MEC4762646.1 SDR family NAD(P)-dependent oxidoreductase [Mycobacterium sherrisii]ODR08757.1 oxidoreductase [Mycobacterium sherrisii]ORW85099.1 oxidoreductase [Mycobacterium sherrisii]
MQMTGNTVLVTGGGTGIGRGLAESLHQFGNKVVIAGRRRDALQAVVSANPGIECMPLDQADAADVRRFVVELTDRHPDLNVVVNNAGIQRVEDLTATNIGLAEQSIAINLVGPIRLISALLPGLLRKPRAAIINVTSGLAFMPSALTPTYCAAKAALHSYTQSLRFQLRGTPVDVIEIIPPQVQTALQGERGFDPSGMPVDEFIAETMSLLQAQPQADEIVVERAKAFRYAERDGTYDDIYPVFNEAITSWFRRESDKG